MWAPDLCIFHGNCDDGFGAAWAIWKRWPDCTFVPGIYGKPIDGDQARGRNVLFVDFSLKQDAMRVLGAVAKSVIVLDHHKTAQEELKPWTLAMGTGETPSIDQQLARLTDPAGQYDVPVVAWFDMEQSGAVMAWKFAHPQESIPEGLQYVQDRDLWRFVFGETTKRFSAALRTYPMEFSLWTDLMQNPLRLVDEGEPILRAHNTNIEKFMADRYLDVIDDMTVPVVNVPYHYASDTAHALLQKCPEAPFAACWFRRGDGMIQYSLRSEDHRVDVSEVAKKFGGGGHRNAAGYQLPA